jgi:hypothetical protein
LPRFVIGPSTFKSKSRNQEEAVKKSVTLIFVCLMFISIAMAQNAPPARTDVYHVHFTAAAPGKTIQLADFLKQPNPKDPMSAHSIVLRHQYGDAWDYVVIQHLGSKASVEASPNPVPAAARDASVWHTDTFVNGPAWPEFVRAMGLGDQSAKTAGAVYVVSVYRALPGHRDMLEKALSAAPPAGDTSAGTVLMQHLEGGPWNYLGVIRFNSWQDLAANENNGRAQMMKNEGGWFELRDHAAFHNDTVTDRIAP